VSYKLKKNHAANQRHWINKRMEWECYLWATQLEEYPNSRRMDMQDVYAWCDKGKTDADKLRRYSTVALALQYPVVVFYGLGDRCCVRGFRYGTDGHEYASGFKILEELE
jgi:hypothetical protein